uniref:Zeta toxin domain-containing protein n=1 Tax=Odontella aurita TaxID=265563 RepID=A0A6U6D9L2_9STRA|mmetsp:Transcript_18990/g.55114  ORF Transcript_18990/g.55114 Transcript_18990/m.55114 type:complete len:365 (+) Transcript_18990:199-1293(+)
MSTFAVRFGNLAAEREDELCGGGDGGIGHCTFLRDDISYGSELVDTSRRKAIRTTTQRQNIRSNKKKRECASNGGATLRYGPRLPLKLGESASLLSSSLGYDNYAESEPCERTVPKNGGTGTCQDTNAKNYHTIQTQVAQHASDMITQALPSGYSLLHSTEQNYCSDEMTFHGPFACVRKRLDYTFHKNYTIFRQQFQDDLILQRFSRPLIVNNVRVSQRNVSPPWIVFTAGPMGAGKGYVLDKLGTDGKFPLESFVKVDPDEIRRDMPEFMHYAKYDPTVAGHHTRKEAGYIAEIITLAALQSGKNVIVDGSVRDYQWCKRHFSHLRAEFPGIRIAILQVSAPREAVLQRAVVRFIGGTMHVS